LKSNEKQESNWSFTDMGTIGAQEREQFLKKVVIRYLNYCCLHLIMRGAITVIGTKLNGIRITISWISTNERPCGENKILCLTRGLIFNVMVSSLLYSLRKKE
jgi:hypothetical protein